MPQIEIDEAEYVALKQRATQFQDAAKVVEALSTNPKTRETFLRGLKTIAPNTIIPEIDARAPIEAALAERDKKYDALAEEVKKDREERALSAQRQSSENQIEAGRKYLRQNDYDDEGVKAVEAFMEKKGLIDYEVAAAAFSKLNPDPTPVVSTGNYGKDWGFTQVESGDDSHKLLLENPTAWKNKEVGKWLAEKHNHRRVA